MADHMNPEGSFADDFLDTYNSAPPYQLSPPQALSEASPVQTVSEPSELPRLNPRSCVTCRRRKVRCDKREPCSNCSKAHIECVFPAPGRAPRKPRRPHDAELMKRLRRLESVVGNLGNPGEDDNGSQSQLSDVIASLKKSASDTDRQSEWEPSTNPRKSGSLEHALGRLVIKEGRSRYVSNDFWERLGDEIADMRDVLDGPSSEDDETPASPETAAPTTTPPPPWKQGSHQAFIFGYSSLMYDMSSLDPSPSQIFILWEIYKENVDPVLKVLHAPTVKNVIIKAAVSTTSLSKAAEALFYAICFGSVVSMSDDQCRSLMGDSKHTLIHKYRFAAEQGLARAGFLNSSSLMVLQAFVVYLLIVRYMDSSKATWSLAGLAMHQAQAQGLHRDGTDFDLDPFETEMRRRVWWHISLLDARAAEDHGADPTFNERLYDTKMPLNVNDDDIWPGMQEAPRERSGYTDNTFCLMRTELGDVQRKLRLSVTAPGAVGAAEASIGEREALIDRTHHRMEEKHFAHCDKQIPFQWVTATVGRLILAKMWLMVHHPRLNQPDSEIPADLQERIFTTSVEVIEFGHLLESNKNTARWGWLFRSYMQWHAVAYVLSELSHRPPGPEAERAWRAVDMVYDERFMTQAKNQRGVLWKPLKTLFNKARVKRGLPVAASSPSSVRSASVPSQRSPADGHAPSATQPTTAGTVGEPGPFDFADLVGGVNPYGGFTTGLDPSVGTTGTVPSTEPFSTPDLQMWSGWSPNVGDFAVGQEPAPTFYHPPAPQEWY